MEMDMEKETQVQVGEEGSEEEESGEEEGAEEGGNSKVSVGRNCLTPLNISFMLQNIDKDEVLKLLVKENEDTDGIEPNLDIDLIVRCFEYLKSSVAEYAKDKMKLIPGCTAVLMVSTNGHNF